MQFLRAGQTGPLSAKQAQALMAALRKPAAEAPDAPTSKAAATSSVGPSSEVAKITLAGPPDRAAKGLAHIEKRLADVLRRVDAAAEQRAARVEPARRTADPALGDLHNAKLFLPLARKAALSARAALIGSEPDFAAAQKALRDLGASLDRTGYLFREALRLTPNHDPLKTAFQGLDRDTAASLHDLEGVTLEVRKAAAKAS